MFLWFSPGYLHFPAVFLWFSDPLASHHSILGGLRRLLVRLPPDPQRRRAQRSAPGAHDAPDDGGGVPRDCHTPAWCSGAKVGLVGDFKLFLAPFYEIRSGVI